MMRHIPGDIEQRDLDEILHSGDLSRIARLGTGFVGDYFGIESFEYLAAEQLEAERNPPKRYRIPKRTGSPAATGALAKAWIREFCQLNELDLPTGFSGKKANQLRGMYQGMLNTYDISEEQVVPPIDPYLR